MRRYSVREAPRLILQHELTEHIRGEEHLHPERPERAAAARRALQEIEMGAPVAVAGHTHYRVNEKSSSRYGVSEGTRVEILAELDRYRSDRNRQGKEEKARQIARGMADLEQLDAAETLVEHVLYRVVEG